MIRPVVIISGDVMLFSGQLYKKEVEACEHHSRPHLSHIWVIVPFIWKLSIIITIIMVIVMIMMEQKKKFCMDVKLDDSASRKI